MSPHAGTILVHQIVPRLRAGLSRAMRPGSTEDAEELLQEATALAARVLHHAEAAGKPVTPDTVAHYALLQLRTGRRFNHSGASDALAPRTQLAGRSAVTSLDATVGAGSEEDSSTLADLLAGDAEDPSRTAARNLDWQALVASLDERTGAVLRCLVAETPLQAVAGAFGVSRSTVQTWRHQLTDAVRAFMGDDVLRQVRSDPRWREDLRVVYERLACRVDRRVA